MITYNNSLLHISHEIFLVYIQYVELVQIIRDIYIKL